MKKRLLALLLVTIMTILPAITACSSGDTNPSANSSTSGSTDIKERTFKIGHIRPENSSADLNVKFFKEELAKASGGKLNVEIYPASQLGDYTVVQERVAIGDVEMQIAPLATNMDKGFGISNAPYIVENWEQAKKVYSSDGELVKAMAALLEKNGIKYLAAYPLYFGGIALIDEPASPGDANVPKNIKIRVPSMKSFELTADTLGYMATPLAWADTFTSMQTGIVDGAIGAGAEGYYSNFRDLIKYYLPLNDHFEMWYLYMNLELWNKLSPEEQKIIQETAKALEQKRFSEAEAEEDEYKSKLEAAGITVIKFTDEELKAFAVKCRENVWPKIKADFGAELFDKITSNIK
ncbi:MAG: TRAP transporter substrate-binding protein DctP [Sedimentibacter sp.]|uniref:TRAP transporter substrate-binding protein DctP n=1 Tax=Sedimentibacter sp. TaxID=1960295 RepID=UPI0031583AC6